MFESKEVWTYEYMIRKGNDHSMLCWFKGRHDDGFEVRTYDLREEGKNYNCYQYPNTLAAKYDMPKVEIAVTTLWEARPYEILLVCISNRGETIHGPPNNNYIMNVKSGEIREAKFTFGKYQDLHLDQHYIGDVCMFRTFDFENGNPLETPVYYIENETEEIIATETWKCSYLHKYDFMGKNTLIEGLYENADVEEVTIMTKRFSKDPVQKWFPRNIIYTHFL